MTLIECPRCPVRLSSSRSLEAHLVEAHLMNATQAIKESREPQKMNGRARRAPAAAAPAAPPPAPEIAHAHVCPTCQTPIACDWAAVATMEQQAQRLKILAGMWRAQLGGTKIGRPRQNTFDVAVARKLVFQDGMTYEAVAQALGASSASAIKSAMRRLERAERVAKG